MLPSPKIHGPKIQSPNGLRTKRVEPKGYLVQKFKYKDSEDIGISGQNEIHPIDKYVFAYFIHSDSVSD